MKNLTRTMLWLAGIFVAWFCLYWLTGIHTLVFPIGCLVIAILGIIILPDRKSKKEQRFPVVTDEDK